MTKITSASKKMLSLLLAVLMLCSGIAVSASAEEATTVEVNQITLGADNCKFINDEYGKKIVINNAKTTVKGSDVEYDVAFTATLKDSNPASTLPSTQDTEKNTTVFQLPVSAANVTYVISAKITVDGKDYAVAKDYEIKIKNAQQAPAAPVPVKITSKSVELKSVVGCEYMLNDGEWQASPKFTGLKAQTKYTVSQRYKETETAYASDSVSVSVTTLKAADADRAPTPVLVDKTQTTITVAVVVDGKTLSGYEFSKDGGKTWQKSGHFTGLTANTMYSFIALKSYDATAQDPNTASEAIKIVTNSKETYNASLDKCGFKITSQPHDDGIYAGDTVGFTASGDSRGNANDLQYGDTRYVPVAYKATQDKPNETPLSANGSGTITTTAKATVTVTVYFEKQKFDGNTEAGSNGWTKVGVESRSFTFEVKDAYNAAKHFFQKVLNFLLDTLPGIINKFLTAGIITKIIEFLKSFGKK